MAFLDLSDAALRITGVPASAVTRAMPGLEALPTAASAQALSDIEWRVIDLARHDRLSSLRQQKPRSWLGRMVFGRDPVSPTFGNERLEALRRLAVEAWHEGYAVSQSALAKVEAVGFSENQIASAMDVITSRRRAALGPGV